MLEKWCLCEICTQLELSYEGNAIHLQQVAIENKRFLFQLPYFDITKHSCLLKHSNTGCGIHLSGKQGLNISIIRLTGMEIASVGDFCYYSIVGVGIWSLHSQNKRKFYLIPLCSLHITYPRTVCISSEETIDIYYYSFHPYSEMKIEFYISPSSCKSITIELCKDIGLIWNTDEILGNEFSMQYFGKSKIKGIVHKYSNIFKVSLLNQQTYFNVNLLNTEKAAIENSYGQYEIHFESVLTNKIFSTGYVMCEYYFNSYHLRAAHHSNSNSSFQSNNYHLLHSSGTHYVFHLDILSYLGKTTLPIISSLMVKTLPNMLKKINSKNPFSHYFAVPAKDIAKLPVLLTRNISTCYKVRCSLNSNLSAATLTIRSVYSRDIF